ncbi:hypothetical protein [Alteromonas sp. a30]|uniref:hypothetical protein n=1 Tax=Alteromonas sp. a30 TaxID=2730917 RepID=UPI00227FF8FC|nr:hypothetical protein [Alteromonas sp. a30]MCY7294466.1 hypothetical protein [Alteromonas sp. a30]
MGWIDKAKGLFVVVVVAITLYLFFASDKSVKPESSVLSEQTEVFQLAFFPEPEPDQAASTAQKDAPNTTENNNQCETLINKRVLTPDWAKSKVLALRHLLVDENTLLPSYDFAFSTLGLSVVKARELSLDSTTLKSKPRYQNTVLPEATHSQLRLITNLIRYGELLPIKKALVNGEFPFNVAIRKGRGVTTLLEHIILDSDNPEPFIQQMMELGVLPTYTDLAAATMFSVDTETVMDMYYASGLTANKVLRLGGRYQSLLTHAVEVKNPELIAFWLEQGSQVNPDPYSPNALDMLQEAETQIGTEKIHELIIAMLHVGASPNTSMGADWVKQHLSDSERQQFASLLKPSTPSLLSSEELMSAQLLVEKVRQLILPSVVDFDISAEPAHPCLAESSRYVMHYLENNAMQQRGNSVVKQKQERKTLLSKFEEAESLYIQQEDIEAHLASDNSIESKELVEAYRREVLDREVKERRQEARQSNRDIDTLNQEAKSLFQSVLELVKSRRWQEAIDHVRAEGGPEALSFLVNLLILYNAPNEYVFSLLDDGVELSSTIMYQLLRQDDVNLAKALIPYGLDLNFKNPLGESGIKLSVNFRAENMFHFLLSQGVNLYSERHTFDALDSALQHIDIQHGKDVFVKGLIEAGAPIRLSHRQWVERKKVTSPQTYEYLVEQYPQLKMP